MTRFAINVIPKSGRSELKYVGETLKAWLKSAPEDGKANDELVRMLADKLEIPRTGIVIVRGLSSRKKIVDIEGISSGQMKKAAM